MFLFFCDFFASLVLKKKNIAQKPLLLLLISLLLFSCFLFFFFLSSRFVKGIWWQRTIHVIKRNEWRQWVWMVTKVWKGGLLLARFSAWQSTKRNVLADNFRLGLAAIVCFLWLSDLCLTQTARGTSASECLSSSPHVSLSVSLSLLCYSLYVYPPFLNTWQKVAEKSWQLVAEKLNLED